MKPIVISSAICGALADFEVTMRLCRETKDDGTIDTQMFAVTDPGALLWMGSDQDPNDLSKKNLYEVPIDLSANGLAATGVPVTATVVGFDFTPQTQRINTLFPDAKNVLCFEELTVTRSDGQTYDLIANSPKSTVPDPVADWTPAEEGKRMMYYSSDCLRATCRLCKTGAYGITCAYDRSYEFGPRDECANDEDNDCDANATCEDTENGYTCTCKPGWIPNKYDGQVSVHGNPGCDPAPEPAPWGEWGPCSVSCGGGTQSRERTDGSETETQDCNMDECPECECAGDDWMCDDAFNCPPESSCQMQNPADGALGFKCTLNEFGTCSVFGDPHIRTFDTAKNDVFGTGEYILAQHGINRDGTIDVDENGKPFGWSVIIDNVPLGEASEMKSVTFSFTVDDEDATIHCEGTTCSTTNTGQWLANTNLDTYTDDDDNYVAEWEIPGKGVTAKYTADNKFELKIAALYKEKVEGLCGQYDEDCHNDFTKKSQRQQLQQRGARWMRQ